MGNEIKNYVGRYAHSQEMLERAEKVIPLGAQTFSKSHIQFPQGHAPLFLTHGRGGRVWDVDGNEYVDMVCGLLSVVLGYCDPDVDAAIQEQMKNGISFSLSHELESDVAERIVEAVPCAEMVRFGKNGTDATSACIRLARAYTRRDRVAVCGYHGWQDWYIGSTVRNLGIPDAVCKLTHRFPYNDVTALEKLLCAYPEEFAAVIMEPISGVIPADGYLQAVKDVVRKHGAVLVFDEVIAGMRFARGGAQEYSGVTPDLASIGKAMGNGMPISAVVGRGDIMRLMEDVFYSGTFGGETLSLAAARAVLDKSLREPVIDRLWQTGKMIGDGFIERVKKVGLNDVAFLSGLSPWQVFTFKDHSSASKEEIRTFFMREMLREGVLIISSFNVCYAHNKADVDKVLGVVEQVLSRLADELSNGTLQENLGCSPIVPIFSIRE
jgi:glutamate-1-semialdehyde 2,1-aminomutase/spore coat polysaccharide biosynthesis protein SpsF